MGNPLGFFETNRGNCEGDPLSPPVGEAAQGTSPLDPHERLDFSFNAAEVQIHSHAPLASPRQGGERPWPHRYPITVPSFSFLRSMISTETKKCSLYRVRFP